MMNINELSSSKGKPMFGIESFLYEVDKCVNGKSYCRCVRFRSSGCPARAVVVKAPEPMVIRKSGVHDHPPDHGDLIKRSTVNAMKMEVLARADKSIKEVYTNVLATSVTSHSANHDAEEVGASLPSFDSVRSGLQRSRAKVRPKLPRSLSEIVIEGEWTRARNGADFHLFDDGANERILGFSTVQLMVAMCETDAIYMDGTFRVVPKLFSQLYTLHGFYKHQMIPYAYFLLPNKSKECYVRMFSLLRTYAASIGKVFEPPKFQLDFEQAALQAIKQEFPLAELKGCHFHFTQALWRKVQEFGLTSDYRERDIRRTIRSMAALALVPLNRINEAWLAIDADAPGPDHPAYHRLDRFKEYFIQTWLENDTIFPRVLWNHYANFGARTTNHIEGWHQALNKIVKKCHVNLFEMIKHLKAQEEAFRNQMLLLDAGQRLPRVNATYRALNERFISLVGELELNEIDLITYTHHVASNIPGL